ncbi:MAG: hypothetical protein ABFD89_12615 [Bryobacteraceae bacterium]
MKKTFNDFIDLCCEQIPWPEADVRRTLDAHLAAAKLTAQDIELYINYPEFTQAELAGMYGISFQAVSERLARVRRAWPSLLRDPVVEQHGVPSLTNMAPYEPWMDGDVKHKF